MSSMLNRKFVFLTREEETELYHHYKKGNQEAARKLIESQIPFVVKTAMASHPKNTEEKQDLIQEGLIGLMRALERFDPAKGRLQTLATWWIKASIKNYIMANWSIVRKITTQEHRRMFPYASRGNAELLCKNCGATPDEAQEFMDRLATDASLNMETESGSSKMDLLTSGETPETLLLEHENSHDKTVAVRNALQVLDQREQFILTYRYMADEPQTLQSLGDDLGLTRERVRQLEKKALQKVRHALCLAE